MPGEVTFKPLSEDYLRAEAAKSPERKAAEVGLKLMKDLEYSAAHLKRDQAIWRRDRKTARSAAKWFIVAAWRLVS